MADVPDVLVASSGFGRRLLFNVRLRGLLVRATIVFSIISQVLITLLGLHDYFYSRDRIITLPLFCTIIFLQVARYLFRFVPENIDEEFLVPSNCVSCWGLWI